MNIFALNRNPRVASKQHFQKHVIKMILESAQMLSTVFWLQDPERAEILNNEGFIYKRVHTKHPCTIWANQCLENFSWLAELAMDLSKEHNLRFMPKNVHKSLKIVEYAYYNPPPTLSALGAMTPFALAMPDDCKIGNPIFSYRTYYTSPYKQHLVDWGKGSEPLWWDNHEIDSDMPPLTNK